MAYAFVAIHNNATAGATTTVSLTVAAGQSLICQCIDGADQGATLSIADGVNTYAIRNTTSDTHDSITYALIDCLAPTPGAVTLTATSSAGSGAVTGLIVLVYTGLASFDNATGFSAFSGWSTATNGALSNAITPASQPGLLLGYSSGIGGTITGNSSANVRANNITPWPSSAAVVVQDQRFTSTASIQSTFTFSSATASNTIIAGTYIESTSGNTAPIAWIT
jgi:hypothetical protein